MHKRDTVGFVVMPSAFKFSIKSCGGLIDAFIKLYKTDSESLKVMHDRFRPHSSVMNDKWFHI